jgi:membrane protein
MELDPSQDTRASEPSSLDSLQDLAASFLRYLELRLQLLGLESFLSFAMVGGVCFLLLVSLTVETVLRGLSDYLKSVMPGGEIVALVLFLVFDLVVVILLFAMIFRYLPDAKLAWRDVWIGATLTAVLFALGKFVLGLYLGSGAAGSAYGAASSLITLLLWIYYAAQILLFGAEFTQVYANIYGTRVEPQEHAVKVEIMEKVVTNWRREYYRECRLPE